MDVAGVFDERYDEIDDINRALRVLSLQLAGLPERRTLDLNTLNGLGVNLLGRLAGVNESKAQFSGSLRNQCALSDRKMGRLLNTINEWVTENGLDAKSNHRIASPYQSRRVSAARHGSHQRVNPD